MIVTRRGPWAAALGAIALVVGALGSGGVGAQEPASTFGPALQGFDYPYPVAHFTFASQRQTLDMAYMDVAPARPNGQVAVLLHGKNFCAATWGDTIAALTAAGYRVVAPDQIGFCKSAKPQAYQFSFRQLAENTHDLLARLGITRAVMIGHSTGGMLAAHYALLYPEAVDRLVLVDPIGLEDWTAKGVPPIGLARWAEREGKTTAATIRAYEQATYYAGQWEPRYERWVTMLAGLFAGPGHDAVAWDAALLDDMIMTQPVLYRFGAIAAPTLLVVGDKDTTAIGKDFAPPAVRDTLGHYAELGRAAARAIPHATLVEFPALGHAPQISDPAAFHAALLGWLARQP